MDKGKGKAKAKAKEDANEVTIAESANHLPPPEILEQLLQQLKLTPETKKDTKKEKKDHPFWNSQPVLDYHEDVEVNSAIEPDKKQEDIRQTPYNLPGGYEWSDVDVSNDEELKELYTLLTMNYVEDDDAMFRFDYSPEFLRWALQPPNWKKMWIVGVRATATNKLVGFISAIPAEIRIYDHSQIMVEVNFLCVHKKLRSKRMAPVLIKEITRRVHVNNIFQATFTAGLVLPSPIASCRYYHRSLNPKKLIETGFSHLGKNMTLARTIKLFKLPDEVSTKGFRPMKDSDIPIATKLLGEYLKNFKYSPVFSEEDFRHWFSPQDKVVYSFVVEDEKGEITDFCSYYSLPSTVINNPNHKTLFVAYCYYYAVTKTPLVNLVRDLLISARNQGHDVFNCLTIMNNKEFLEELKFGVGDGELQYYLYNWQCKKMAPEGVGLVLL